MSEKKEISEKEVKQALEKARQIIGAVMLTIDPNVIIGKIKAYLDILNLKYFVDPKQNVFIVPFVIRDNAGYEHKHDIMISIEGSWVISRTKVVSIPRIPADVREKLYRLLLRANADIAECNFGLDEDNNIVLTESILITALHFEPFAEEFLAIPTALKYFWSKIYPEIREDIERSMEVT